MDALREIGIKKALKYALFSPMSLIFDFLPYSPLRVLFLRLMGAKIGKNVILGQAKFVNLYRGGYKVLTVKDNCVIDDYVLFDLANPITLEEHVSLGWGVSLITHRNVGYKEHPLQQYFPVENGPIKIGRGSFLGVNVTVLHGVNIGEGVCVGANSLVVKDLAPWILAVGTPAKESRKLK